MGCSVPGIIDTPNKASHSIHLHCRHRYLRHPQRTGGIINMQCNRIKLTNRVGDQNQYWGRWRRFRLPKLVLITPNPIHSMVARQQRRRLHLCHHCGFGCSFGCGVSDSANKVRKGGIRDIANICMGKTLTLAENRQ